ncbi:S-adenosyl-L-methionine-dependent methyltransferase [Mycena rebaudengoi]|nr:S-adenosyl-L-methionine-dependent methyltransferase [Mycena rebaudengoi]
MSAPLGISPHGPQKDVQAALLRQYSHTRRPGSVPYPLNYSLDMVNFDNWDQMFLRSCCSGLTMHQFDKPPQFILDLGCGGGFWAVEAAKQWPDARVVGFDLKDIQPQFLELDAYSMRCLEDGGESPRSLPIADLSPRVKWVHGNLLDGLPFPAEYFDFVHIAGIGLGVPEDEWQFVFEEVSRVMKSGGVLEIIEEDLLFPCAPPRSRRRLAPLDLNFSRERRDSAPPSAFSSHSSGTLMSDMWSIPESPEEHRAQKKPSLPTLSEVSSLSSIPFEPPLSTRNTAYFPMDDESVINMDTHPTDHTRLKAAWDAMLARRFLSSSLVTVLPFYLSSFFENVQTHPSLQISLPPSSIAPESDSRSSNDSFDADTLFDLNPSVGLSDDVHSIKSNNSSHRSVPFWGRMHLAKTVKTVTACKEALWIEYENLYPGDLPPIARTARPKDVRSRPVKHSPREAFETDWSSWEHDMADRISMRGRITTEFGWAEPEPHPDWRIWRNRTAAAHDLQSERTSSPHLCRSLRGFVGWKPSSPSSPRI